MKEKVVKGIERLLGLTKSMVVATCAPDGQPVVKTVTRLGRDGLSAFYFATAPKCDFWQAYRQSGKASIVILYDDPDTPYPSAEEKYYSLICDGRIDVVEDGETRKRIWDGQNGYFDGFYKGVEDPAFHLLRFVALKGKYFNGDAGDYFTESLTF